MTLQRLLSTVILVLAGSAGPASAQERVRHDDSRFVASSRGEVYYAIGCDAARRLSPRNARYFRTAVDAEEAGYRPSQSRGCAPHLDTALITPTPNGSAECVVARIIDGDTFQCEGGSRVRLLIADADEIGQSVFADSATMLLERLMPVGTPVRLEFDVAGLDRYRRVLAYAYAGGVFVNRELVRRGFAQIAIHPPNVRSVHVLRAATDSARNERAGLWQGSAFDCTPADYRAGRCR